MTNPNVDIIGNILRDKLAEQPLVKRYANTATSLLGLGINAIWVMIGLGVDVPTPALIGVAVAVQGLATIGVKFTPNGVTEKQITEIEDYAGKHRADG